MLEIKSLAAGYGALPVIRDLSLSVGTGEVLSLVGRNGVGKTTTLRAIMGLADIHAGSIRVGSAATAAMSPIMACRLGIGYVAQQREVCPDLSVEQNLLLPLYANKLPASTIDTVYARFPKLADRKRQVAGTLSGGERKLLAFGRIMLLKPRIYLVDEPTEGLMPQAVDEIMALIAGLRTAGACVLLVEQNLEMVRRLSDRIAFMNNGKIDAVTTGLDDTLVARYLGV